MFRSRIFQAVLLVLVVVATLGCNGANSSRKLTNSGGATATSGAPVEGGTNAQGGTKATGGMNSAGGTSSAGGAANGGTPSSGGSNATGVSALGGAPATGSNSTAGGATGGTNSTAGATTGGTNSATDTSTGGTAASGGSHASGGSAASGGTAIAGTSTAGYATGGTINAGGTRTAGTSTGGTGNAGGASTGGTAVVGGSHATGGSAPPVGGTTITGGTQAVGGTSNSAGASTGGTVATGGVAGSGGSQATGGTTGPTSLSWDFATDTEGWIGAFADYPPNLGTGYDLEYGWSSLPPEVGPGGGLRINGNNHSDDLFMYVTRKITGLAPQKRYLLDVVVTIDSNAPSDCGGIGGAPGLDVYFKIGAVSFQPASSLDSKGQLILNLDKGNQSGGGADMKVVGNIGNTLLCPNSTYQAKTLSLSGFSVTSAADGTLWIILGTDSGFEGITTLYYDRIAVTLQPSN
jgi:hypothetical protein